MKIVGGLQSKSSTRILAVSLFCMVATSRIFSVSSFLAAPVVPSTAGAAGRHVDSCKKTCAFFSKTTTKTTTTSRTHNAFAWNHHRFTVSSSRTTTGKVKSRKSLSRTNAAATATLDDDDQQQRHDGPRPDGSSLALSSVPVVTMASSTIMFLPLSGCRLISTNTIQLVLGHVLGGLLGLPFVAGAIPTWYRNIDLPAWTPPNQIFGPVWTLLYASMGWSLSIVLSKLSETKVATTTASFAGIVWSKNNVLALWAVHYGLNLLWAPVFFGLQRLRLGLLISYAMVATLLAVMVVYHAIVPRAAYVLIPYLCWITFATILNQAICRRNPMCENGKINKAMRMAQLARLQKKQPKSASKNN